MIYIEECIWLVWYHFHYFILLQNLVCEYKLGMEDGRITDSQITASSELGFEEAAFNARLNSQVTSNRSGAWTTGNQDQNPWIQARVNARWITGIMTQGRNNPGSLEQWVTQYKVQYSNDGTTWTYVMTGNQETMVSVKRCGRKEYYNNIK